MALVVRKRGKYWTARGTVPMRQADGKIAWVRIEESTREVSKARAIRAAQDIFDHYREQAYRPTKASPTFTDAAITYVETKGMARFVAELVAHFGETPIAEIDQAAAAAACHALYPGCKASTHVRAVYAPLTTILRLSGVRSEFTLPKLERVAKNIPPDDWFDAILSHSPPRLSALLIFLTLTGRRISEALEAIDNGDGTVGIGRTKSGAPVNCLYPVLCHQLWPLGGSQRRVWSYGDRHNVYRELRKVCKKAGLPYYGTHALGRHAFATRLLREGKSLKFVADAGGWASIKMPAQHYAHLEKSEVQEQVKEVGIRWGKAREKARKSQKSNV